MDIYLVVYDRKAFEISGKLLEKVKSYIDETLVKTDYIRTLNISSSKPYPVFRKEPIVIIDRFN